MEGTTHKIEIEVVVEEAQEENLEIEEEAVVEAHQEENLEIEEEAVVEAHQEENLEIENASVSVEDNNEQTTRDEMLSRPRNMTKTNILAIVIMVIAQINIGLVTISYKYLGERDYSLRVIVAYRLVLATILYPPAAFINERYLNKTSDEEARTPPSLSWNIVGLASLCGLFAFVVSYNLSALGSQLASPTAATAISNVSPAITFVAALVFRRENLNLHTWAGRAKVLGTIIAIAGAMIVSFCKGPIIIKSARNSQFEGPLLPYGQQPPRHQEFLGILAALGSCLSGAAAALIEDKILEKYPNSLQVSAMMVASGAVQAAFFAAIMDHKGYKWWLEFAVQGALVFYMAIMASGVFMALTTWCMYKKGPFFLSIFAPITLIFVAAVSPFLVGEPLRVGGVIGAVVTIVGIYLVVWGKKDENKGTTTGQEEVRREEAEPQPEPEDPTAGGV